MKKATRIAVNDAARRAAYAAQNSTDLLTPRQQRRVTKKLNHMEAQTRRRGKESK